MKMPRQSKRCCNAHMGPSCIFLCMCAASSSSNLQVLPTARGSRQGLTKDYLLHRTPRGGDGQGNGQGTEQTESRTSPANFRIVADPACEPIRCQCSSEDIPWDDASLHTSSPFDEAALILKKCVSANMPKKRCQWLPCTIMPIRR